MTYLAGIAAFLLLSLASQTWAVLQGKPAETLMSLPWQAALSIYGPTQQPFLFGPQMQWQFGCGGSIIDTQWILTAAHCVYGKHPTQVKVVTGEYDLNARYGPEIVHAVQAIYPHYGYVRQTNSNDVALLKLSTPIHYDSYRKPIPLASAGDSFTKCQLSGWGKDIYKSSAENLLRYTNVNTVSLQTCANMHASYARLTGKPGPTITTEHICVGGVSSGACYGDSGGPLTCDKTGSSSGQASTGHGQVLAGVTSTGTATCGGAPSVYASVPFFRQWIDTTMRTYSG